MRDTSHLEALEVRLSHERVRLSNAKTPYEGELRTVWVAGIEKEIASEKKMLGMTSSIDTQEMTDDELLAELTA